MIVLIVVAICATLMLVHQYRTRALVDDASPDDASFSVLEEEENERTTDTRPA